MLKYKTKKTAQTAFNREKKKLIELMCPIFKVKCLGDKCVSFSGRVYILRRYKKPDVYRMHSPCCSNAIVNGYIEMEPL